MLQLLVRGAGSPDLPLRLLNLLVQQGAVVTKAEIELLDGDYHVSVYCNSERSAIILEKIRAMVLVFQAELMRLQDVS